MKKYYCPVCKEFKNRLQVKKADDTRTVFFECRYCHCQEMYLTENLIKEMAEKLRITEIHSKHGSFL